MKTCKVKTQVQLLLQTTRWQYIPDMYGCKHVCVCVCVGVVYGCGIHIEFKYRPHNLGSIFNNKYVFIFVNKYLISTIQLKVCYVKYMQQYNNHNS